MPCVPPLKERATEAASLPACGSRAAALYTQDADDEKSEASFQVRQTTDRARCRWERSHAPHGRPSLTHQPIPRADTNESGDSRLDLRAGPVEVKLL
jgi:hypothetical protein